MENTCGNEPGWDNDITGHKTYVCQTCGCVTDKDGRCSCKYYEDNMLEPSSH